MRHRRAMDTSDASKKAGYKKGVRVLPRQRDRMGGGTGGMRRGATSSQRLEPVGEDGWTGQVWRSLDSRSLCSPWRCCTVRPRGLA